MTYRIEYDSLKSTVLEFTIEISTYIEDNFSTEEKRKVDCKIVFEEYDRQLEKLRALVITEDNSEFMSPARNADGSLV